MTIKRILRDIGFMTKFTSVKRAEYAKRKKIFKGMGNKVRLPFMRLPLYPENIIFHNNIEVASGVSFITHDAIHGVLNNVIAPSWGIFEEEIFQIEIFDNVFIGANAIICGNVKIGPNAIIGAGSLVNRDVPEGCIYAGVPAKKIGDFKSLMKKRCTNKKGDIN